MTATTDLYVKSHVARDLLQSAGLFKTDKLVVWEYVSNGLQYVSAGTNPSVRVSLDSKKNRIIVRDNGRGMDWLGLQNFFLMHGENIDRKEGRAGRGMFGTGKSAAFGIADTLRIKTVRNGRKSTVELTRQGIETMSSEDPIPVNILEKESSTAEPNGTTIEIEGIHLKSLDQAGIIHYIERHLARWPKNATVYVNNHECEFSEPPVSDEFRFSAEGPLEQTLEDAELVLKVSKSPLEEELRGVAVYSNGVWHETTLAGSEGREMSQFIFGDIDVPQLDADKSPIRPFDISRSMRLNPENDLVQAIHCFIGTKVEQVRRQLVEMEKKQRAEEDTRKLANQALEIARVINEDFEAFRQRVAKVRAKARGGSDPTKTTTGGDDLDDDFLSGNGLPAKPILPIPHADVPDQPLPPDKPTPTAPQPPTSPVEPAPDDAANLGKPAGGAGAKRKPAGGFNVMFRNMGRDSQRAQYFPEERTIYINLEHPQLAMARGGRTVDDPVFRRLAYEVAFTEYAIALAQELEKRGEYLDPSDPLVDIRATINRVACRGAHLYSE
jgi:histidine kinase/DNA gyrase B/HSP90-like ATPase